MYNRFFSKRREVQIAHSKTCIILVQKIITLKRDAYEPERLKPEFRLILFDSYTGNIYR